MPQRTNARTPEYAIVDLTADAYALPLTAPVDLGGTVITERRGLLVAATVEGPNGTRATGFGDVAPLPAFSTESLAEAKSAARDILDLLVGTSFSPAVFAEHAAPLGDHVRATPPSVQFGIEQAVLFAAARASDVLPTSLLSDTPREAVSLNALLTGTPPEILGAADGVQHYAAVKVKIGRHNVHDEAACVRALWKRWNGDVSIRLDANRAWTVAEANTFAEGIRGVEIEYLEEPLREADQLHQWAVATGVPVALDETTREMTPVQLAEQTFASAFVIKPTLIGFSQTLRLAREVAPVGVDLVISSAYESGVGLTGLAMLAASIGDHDIPAGLDTYRRLETDIVQPRLDIAGPRVHLSTLWTSLTPSLDDQC
jgi:O-succinylbenzoate synthase